MRFGRTFGFKKVYKLKTCFFMSKLSSFKLTVLSDMIPVELWARTRRTSQDGRVPEPVVINERGTGLSSKVTGFIQFDFGFISFQ